MIEPDSIVTKIEKSAVERFKNENDLLKKFGSDGLKVYRSIEENSYITDIIKKADLDETKVFDILEYMESKGMIVVTNQNQNYEDNEIDEDEYLSETERKIKDNFGEIGLRVYSLIDGVRTAQEIMEEANVTEAELMEILSFLEREKIISLDQPVEDKTQKTATQASKTNIALKEEVKTKAPPLEELDTHEDEILDSDNSDIIPIDLPFKSTADSFKIYPTVGKLALKYGKKISDLYASIDGYKDIITLALEHNLTLPQINSMLAELGKSGLVLFRQLTRKEIKARYGEEGLIIYKLYGVEGVFVYELIGKVDNLRTMLNMSGLEPKRLVDIFVFTHKVLGIEIPVSKKILYKQLGIESFADNS
ncbi:MAG: hypothetical protein N3E37_05270 [Candidatus Micrarchaeota archaeon]|nr:hypothetical protein [Candidatus Micrarchaeota archaeon]